MKPGSTCARQPGREEVSDLSLGQSVSRSVSRPAFECHADHDRSVNNSHGSSGAVPYPNLDGRCDTMSSSGQKESGHSDTVRWDPGTEMRTMMRKPTLTGLQGGTSSGFRWTMYRHEIIRTKRDWTFWKSRLGPQYCNASRSCRFYM